VNSFRFASALANNFEHSGQTPPQPLVELALQNPHFRKNRNSNPNRMGLGHRGGIGFGGGRGGGQSQGQFGFSFHCICHLLYFSLKIKFL
jgi:hypothetical protein